jgi:ABC-2 type transport system permease protein
VGVGVPALQEEGGLIVRVLNLIRKELIQFRRDRLLALFILLAPALQLILLARTVERGIRQQPVAILDLDRSPRSRELWSRLDNTEELQIRYQVDSEDQVRALLDEGKARLAVIIPAGFARELERVYASDAGASPARTVQVLSDATNTVAASITMGAAAAAVNRFSADLAEGRGSVVPELIDFRTNVRFNPGMDIRTYTIPAQLGFITYQVTLAVAALGLARERELGTLEQLMVTPLRRPELALGKGIPAMVIGGLNFLAMWAIGIVVFHVPMNGSPLLLVGLTVLFLFAVVSWGLLLSAISRTQQQAILFVFIQAMIDMTLSGYLVSTRNMPPLLRALSQFVPLQYYLDIVRNVMIKGAGLAELWPQALALAALGLVMSGVALRSVARRLE